MCAVPTDVSPPPQRSSVGSRQLYTSGISDETAGPSSSRDEGKSLRVPCGSFCYVYGKSNFERLVTLFPQM